MKTSIKNIVILSISAFTLVFTGFTAHATETSKTVTSLAEIRTFNQLNVSGNVSETPSVKVYDSYYSKNALVQEKNGELRISSFDKEPLTVVVYASSLKSITASGNASVRTLGKFSALSLDINLKDNANATLNSQTLSLSAKVNDKAQLSLTGSSNEYNAVLNNLAKLNLNQFVTENTNIETQNLVSQNKSINTLVISQTL